MNIPIKLLYLDMILFLFIYLLLSVLIAYFGSKKEMGFLLLLMVSIFFSPIMGLIVMLKTSKMIGHYDIQHECPECGNDFKQHHEHCPICVNDGKHIDLKSYSVIIT